MSEVFAAAFSGTIVAGFVLFGAYQGWQVIMEAIRIPEPEQDDDVDYVVSRERHPTLTQKIEGEISPQQRKWNDLLQQAKDNPDKEPEEEPWGVTEFTPVEPKPFDPDEYLDEVLCTSCSRPPLRGEDVYEVPMGEGLGVKVLCSLCGKVPTS